MKLTTMTQVTVDGVMQGNGGASDEDRRNGFERGGWALGKGDAETVTFINEAYRRADAFLFGRRTYELFAGSWGTLTEQDVPGWEPVMRALNARPKYVASSTLADPEWSGTDVLSDDLATTIADLTAEAIRLTRLLRALLPDDGEVAGLLALMLLTEARRAARVSSGGELVALGEHRAIAVAELDGPEVALAAVNRLEDELAGYHAYHATRADLLRRLGQSRQSRAAYDKAIELAGNTAEIAALTRRRDQLRQR